MKAMSILIFLFTSAITIFSFKNILKQEEWSRSPAQYNTDEALKFMDRRTANWLTTSISKQHDGSTRCLSCHTVLSYSLSRAEHGDTPELRELKRLITLRVEEFSRSGFVGGWYSPFIEGSISTETIINSLSLISMDLAVGDRLSQLTERSLEQMWKRQIQGLVHDAGGFQWLDGYGLEPLEADKTGYWATSLIGSTLADIPGYTNRRDVEENLKALKQYIANNFDDQNLHNKLMAIEANQKLGGQFLPPNKVEQTLNQVLALREASGGWDLHKLVNRRGIGQSDNYATAMVVRAFLVSEKYDNPEIKKALTLLKNSQSKVEVRVPGLTQESCDTIIGSFLGFSVNSGRNSRFMTDLATSMSIKTLTMAKKLGL